MQLSMRPFTFNGGATGLISLLWCSHIALAKLSIDITTSSELLPDRTDGRVMVLFAPAGIDPLDDTDVTSSPNKFFGKNVFGLKANDSITLTGDAGEQPLTEVWGFPNASLDDISRGQYRVQAFLNRYETVIRSDGSTVSVRFPCGDGAVPVNGPGSLTTEALEVSINGSTQTIQLSFNNVTAALDFNGTEIGGCSQGNYEDTELLKHIKIRSDVLSKFWDRDMYVGANVLLPSGYNNSDSEMRYPVLYHQSHWPADTGLYGYSTNDEFTTAWDSGIVPNTTDKATPKLIMVTLRHETPFYDDSYAVNTANIGPYGDAINDELIPYLDAHFNTIASAYGRIQDGGSTGGWESAANLVFRPDLFGACFSSYPDSMSFKRHQDIPLYNATSAYTRPDGSKLYSIREVINGTLTPVTTVEQENHWELTYGTNSRSSQQWDVWNAVFGAQGLNGSPLESWDKVTGEIFPEAVEFFRPMDLAQYISDNWDNERNLGEVLRRRMFIYVGSWDNYFLNEGVQEFQKTVSALGGSDWANVTILPEQIHGGNYELRPIWNYLELVVNWTLDHATGKSPLSDDLTKKSSRGNLWEEVIVRGGHEAALARQSDPCITANSSTGAVEGDVGRWDPGVTLQAVWLIDGKRSCEPFEVEQGTRLSYPAYRKRWSSRLLQLEVTGRKRGYVDETRRSEPLTV